MKSIKFILAFILIVAFSLNIDGNLYSQVYQLPNPGFENWDGGEADEPTNWNSYPSANCTILIGCGIAKQKRHDRSTDVRPGSTGQYSCKIYSTSALGVIANGAITTGQMQLVNASLSSDNNGNRTITSNSNFHQKFDAKPDSIVFWAKAVNVNNSSLSCCHLYIHDEYQLQDPLVANPAGYEAHIVGKVPNYDFTNNGSTWQRHSAPIIYDGCQGTTPKYILITISTNKDAGGGNSGDVLYIDDIEFIYNANLSSITVNGEPIPDFNENTTTYYVKTECGVTNYLDATTVSPRASWSSSLSPDGKTATITVNHGDKTKTYQVIYNDAELYQTSDRICTGDSYSLNGFTIPTQENAGVFTFRNQAQLPTGCDSIMELTLTVYNSYTSNIDLTICESATYDFYGQTLSEAGTYRKVFTSQDGCDSTFVLNLLVDSYYQTNIQAHICEGEIYNEGGFDNRTDAGYDTLRLVATNQCDSIVVLHLEVGTNNYVELYDSIYTDSVYNNFGFNIEPFIAEGEFSFTNTYTNAEGCDSVVTLTLKVLPRPIEEPNSVPENVTFSVYPSPAVNEINIEANYDIKTELYDYCIYDINGKVVAQGVIDAKITTINISDYNSGYYLLKVKAGDKKSQKRKSIRFYVAK
ncbi:MAG: T9SS type A sorting domain-containing protein [Bacteroidales bacterium]|nr:T9SS type A sorting domain-containing protein [Bacteroidales bacterium]